MPPKPSIAIPVASVSVAFVVLWVLLAGTMNVPSWLLRQSVALKVRRKNNMLRDTRILYSHNIPIWLGQNLDKPESFGFLRESVRL